MFEPLGTPTFLADARRAAGRRSPVMEIIIFFVLTLVAQFFSNLVTVAYELVYLFGDEVAKEIVLKGDMEAALAYSEVLAEKIMGEPLFILLLLFSTAVTVALVLLYARKVERRSYLSLGLAGKPYKEYVLGLGVGLLLFAVALGFAAVFGSVWYEGLSARLRPGYVVFFLIAYAVQGFSEELLCRGYLMVAMGKNMPLWMGVVISAFAFSALHVSNTSCTPLGFINIFLFGVMMALYMIRRGSLWGAAAIHTAWNFAEGILTDSYVSGTKMPVSIFAFGQRAGDDIIHGGGFGPEGGIAVSFVLVIGIVLLLMAKTKGNADPMLNIPKND